MRGRGIYESKLKTNVRKCKERWVINMRIQVVLTLSYIVVLVSHLVGIRRSASFLTYVQPVTSTCNSCLFAAGHDYPRNAPASSTAALHLLPRHHMIAT